MSLLCEVRFFDPKSTGQGVGHDHTVYPNNMMFSEILDFPNNISFKV